MKLVTVVCFFILGDQTLARQVRRAWGKHNVCSPRNCNSCDAFLNRYAGTKKTRSREFQFCSSMRRNKNCCGLLGSGIVTMVGSTSECCSDISGCIVPIANVDTAVGEESIGKIMEDMEQCVDSNCEQVIRTTDRCLSSQTDPSKRPQYILVISAFVLVVVVLIGAIVAYQYERNRVQKNHVANSERKSLVEHPK